MRHYLLVTWDGAGNVPPELSVLRELAARGHRVSVLGDPTLRAEAEAVGAGFRPWVTAPHLRSRAPEDHLIRDFDAKTPPQLVARLSERLIATPASVQAQETLDAIRQLEPDVLLVSGMLVGPQIAGEAAGIPTAALLGNIYWLPARGIPPFGTGWRPMPGRVGRVRDAAVNRLGTHLWNRGLPEVNAARTAHGLAPLANLWSQLDHAAQVLVLTSTAFDFAGELPPNVRYTGPQLEDPSWAEPWEPPPGEDPIVLVSLSSAMQDQLALLRKIVAAAATLPVRAVVTTGHAIEPADLPAPAHVQVLRTAPHGAVLAQAAAVVNHGGHGTVIKALAAGVPQLVIPMGRDQLDNAARVVARGAGLRCRPSARPPAIEAALRRVLSDPSLRSTAAELGRIVRADAQGERAADELERLTRTHPGACSAMAT